MRPRWASRRWGAVVADDVPHDEPGVPDTGVVGVQETAQSVDTEYNGQFMLLQETRLDDSDRVYFELIVFLQRE